MDCTSRASARDPRGRACTEGSGRVPGPVAARRAPRDYPPPPCIPGSTGIPESERHGLTPIQPHRADAGAARTFPLTDPQEHAEQQLLPTSSEAVCGAHYAHITAPESAL